MPNGVCVTNITMDTNRIWQGQDGERRTETDWYRYGLGTVVEGYVGKGKRVRVIGRLEYQT